MVFKEIVNKEGNYIILAEKTNNVEILYYNSLPYSGYSKESMAKVKEMRQKAKKDPKMVDGPGVRLSEYHFVDGTIYLGFDKTSYFYHAVTRKNKDKQDCANWFGCSGITLTKDGKDYFMWIGEKSKLNEIGSGQKQLVPAGGLNPITDFGLDTIVKRELHEEALRVKPLTYKSLEYVLDKILDENQKLTPKAIKDNLLIELVGGKNRNGTYENDIVCMRRDFFDVESKAKLCKPFMLMDMYDMRSFNLAHILILDMTKEEMELTFNFIPKSKREFNNIIPLEFKKNSLADYVNQNYDSLRPQVRAAVDSVTRNWDYVSEILDKHEKSEESQKKVFDISLGKKVYIK